MRRLEALGPPVLANAVTLATQIASFVVQLVLVLMLSFYIMLDGPRIMRGVRRVMPDTYREDLIFFVDSVNRAFAGFLRGQLIQALLYSLGHGRDHVGGRPRPDLADGGRQHRR